jgi:copper chaperone CopZ
MEPTAGHVTTTLTIRGMTAVHAVRAVFTALSGVEGILRADVAMGRATVEHDGRATGDALRQAVEMAGFELTGIEESRRRLPLL